MFERLLTIVATGQASFTSSGNLAECSISNYRGLSATPT
jgi:hypothetical protein